MDGPDRFFLVAVDMGDLGGDTLPHVRVEDFLSQEVIRRHPLTEGARKTDVRSLHER